MKKYKHLIKKHLTKYFEIHEVIEFKYVIKNSKFKVMFIIL